MFKKNVCLIVVMIFFTGCANMSDTNRTKAEGAGYGAAGGAALGALVGLLAGGNTKSVLAGAAIGAAAGLIGGYAYGSHVANKKAEYASEEDYLNACIASARKINNDTRKYNASLGRDIKRLDKKINRLVAKYNKQQVSRSNLYKEKKKVESMLATANQKLKRAKDEVSIQKQVLAQGGQTSKSSTKLDKEISKLEKTVRELEGQTTALAGINQKLSV